MTPKNNFKNYLPYILILLLLLGGGYAIHKYTNKITELEDIIAQYKSNESKMEGEFVKINDEYNALMSSLSERDQLLISSQAQLKEINEQLKSVLEKKNITEEDLAEAKALIATLKSSLKFENQITGLNDKIAVLEEKNTKSAKEIVEYKELLSKREKLIKEYKTEVAEKEKIIEQGSTLRLINFEMKGVNVKANGKEVETDKAKKADKLRVKFTVNSNNISKDGTKDLYLVLYNSDKELAHFPDASTGTLNLVDGSKIDYTDHISIYYEKGKNEEIKFDWENDDFDKGEYTILVYENGYLIGSQSISFR